MGIEPVLYPDLVGGSMVVTGAGRGIGEALVLGLVRNGVNVVAADLDGEAVAATALGLADECRHGARIVPAASDASRIEDQSALGELALAEFGSLTGWVNNAGVLKLNALDTLSEDEFTQMFRVHAIGSMLGGQVAVPLLDNGGGAVVNVASIMAYNVRPGVAGYSTTKAALEHLTKFQAVEYGPRGVRVNAVAPGMIDTVMSNHITQNPQRFDEVVSAIPLRRFGHPAEVANAILFLLSDASSFITGHTLVVDGASRHR